MFAPKSIELGLQRSNTWISAAVKNRREAENTHCTSYSYTVQKVVGVKERVEIAKYGRCYVYVGWCEFSWYVGCDNYLKSNGMLKLKLIDICVQ